MADVVEDRVVVGDGRARSAEPSTAELVQRATEQMSRLIRDELALARAEVTEKGKRVGIGVGLFGGAGAFALYGVGALTATAILLLAEVLPAWAAAGIVTLVLLAVAGVLALVGRGQLRRVGPPAPDAVVRGLREDVNVVATALRERGRA